MARELTPDICIIGAGSGGLSTAAAAAQMGADVVLVEKDAMGGDCLNTGCVPSKALLAAAKCASQIRKAGTFGIDVPEPEIDFARVNAHVRDVIASIAPNDSVERFTGMGVHVITAAGEFTGPDCLRAGEVEIRARRFVIATGSSPAIPPIPGLENVDYLTNETLFNLTVCPEHLIIIGGGPIGMEMAQAHRRLGASVTVLEMFAPFGRDDPELAAVVIEALEREGVAIHGGTSIESVARAGEGIRVGIEKSGRKETITGSHLLVAAGRRPNTAGLGLEKAGIRAGPRGIAVDASLRTSNRRAYAIGDVAGGYQFTHVAGDHAGTVIRNILFRLPARARMSAIPWVTYTDPELAWVGLDEAEARKIHGDIRVLRWPFAENDRALAERQGRGMIKVLTARRGRILGAGIVGAHAGENIQPWIMAIEKKQGIRSMVATLPPYPTYGEISKRAAVTFYRDTFTSPRIKWLVRFLARFG